jgi:hypothetical protein
MKRHRTDVVSLVFGLLFLALPAWWAVAYYLDWTVNWNLPNFGWIAAGVLIVVGLFGVVASLRRDRPEPALAEGPATASAAGWDASGPPLAEGPVSTSAAGYEGMYQPSEEPPTIADSGPTTADLGPTDPAATDVPRDDVPRDDVPRDERY